MKFSKELESEYNKEPDLWFKVSLMLLFGVFVGIQIVHGVVSVRLVICKLVYKVYVLPNAVFISYLIVNFSTFMSDITNNKE